MSKNKTAWQQLQQIDIASSGIEMMKSPKSGRVKTAQDLRISKNLKMNGTNRSGRITDLLP